jgi:hypothetical protein
VPRADHDTVTESEAISLGRLATRTSDLRQAATTIEHALADALELPHPTPVARELSTLVAQLHAHIDTLIALQDRHHSR